jgi:prepilin-type N-terminal cleavage/methylation domain-containing protein
MRMHGFTLLELVIVIALVALMVTVPVMAYGTYLQIARDVRRKSDVAQLQAALHLYRAERGTYPLTLEELVSAGHIPRIPLDPRDGQLVPGGTDERHGYRYQSDGVSYEILAPLERGSANGQAQYHVATQNGSTDSAGLPTPTIPVPTNTPLMQPTIADPPGMPGESDPMSFPAEIIAGTRYY